MRFETYGVREGLLSNFILRLFEGSDGTLWIGTRGGGLSAMRDGRIGRTYTQADGLPSASANFITEDAGRHIWVGSGHGFARLVNDRFVPVPGTPGMPHSLYCDHHGVVWAGFPALWRWEADHWIREPDGGPDAATSFCEDPSGQLWVGGNGRNLWCREADGWRYYRIPDSIAGNYPSTLVADHEGTIWINVEGGEACGLRNGNFVRPAPRGETFPRFLVAPCIAVEDHLWMGGARGLFALTPPRTSIITLNGGDENNMITALAEVEPGTFVVGSSAHSWFRWRDGLTSRVLDEKDSANYSYGNDIIVTRDHSIWAASSYALLLFRNGRRVPRPDLETPFANTSVIALCEDRTGGVWAGTSNGKLYQVDSDSVTPVPYGGRTQAIFSIAQAPDATLWVATLGDGVYRLRGGESRRFGRADGLSSEGVRVVYVAPDGTLWAGMAGGGLAKLEGDRFISVGSPEGLSDDTVSQIISDDEGRLWVGTNRGLSVIDREQLSRIHVGKPIYLHPFTITMAEGMLAEECMPARPVRTSSGQLAFATTNGIVLLRPGDFHPEAKTPPVFIEDVLSNGQPVAPQGGILSLPPSADRLQIRFTALHFAAPEAIRFRYRLTGLDTSWILAGEHRTVDYSHLRPGRYRFEVTASIGKGLWNSSPATLEIVRAPHFWETWWFILGFAALFMTAVVLGVRRRERMRARRRIEALERQQAIYSERARISRDLHDDVGSSLTQMALLSEIAKVNLTRDADRARSTIEEIFVTAQDVTRNLDEIVWAVNPAHDTVENFVLYICNFAQNYTRNAGLQSRLDIPKTLPVSDVPATTRHQVYLATKEVLHNAVKHAEATEIRIGLAIEPGWFRLTIADNGKGFQLNAQSRDPFSDGVGNLQQRLQHLGGTCTYSSQPGVGTSVEMAVPLS